MFRSRGGFQSQRNSRHQASSSMPGEVEKSDRNLYKDTSQNFPRSHSQYNKHGTNHRRGCNPRQERSFSVDRFNPNFKRSRQYPLGFKALQDILNKEPHGIIMELLNENSGYKLLLGDANITPDKVFLLFKVISKACKSTSNKENLLELLSLTFCKLFINMLSTFIIKILTFEDQPIKDFFANLFEICFFLQYSRPYESIDSFDDIIHATLLVLKGNIKYGSELAKCKELRNRAEETRQMFIDQTVNDKKDVKLLRLKFQNINMDEMEPPDDFRKISVLPTAADICVDELPFLRRNVIEGKYKDPYHYLDVQFRLLREDFIRPLREGLSHFREQSHKKEPLRNRDLNIYKKVKVDKTELVNTEFVYYLQLNLPRHLKMESSKRLMFGNLLCFSKDRFQTMVFGYVYDRDIVKLKKGIIGVKFESKPIDFTGAYDMAESRAYFVAYQHVLEALQNIQDSELPLRHYFVDVSNDMHIPKYILHHLYYDFRVIKNFNLMKESKTLQFFETSANEPAFNFFPELARIRFTTSINLWPSAELLSLDETQRAALYGALTRQMAIIQGPPGTGKTFLGLKVTQILLHNCDKWDRNEPGPILVVCYTNHALDQFLEGMLKFTSSIVRVGSRSKSEILSQFQISNLAKLSREKRLIPQAVYTRNSQLYSEIKLLEENIDELQVFLNELKDPKGIFSHGTLRRVIPTEFDTVLENVGIEDWVLGISESFKANNDDTLVKPQDAKHCDNLQPSGMSSGRDNCNAHKDNHLEDSNSLVNLQPTASSPLGSDLDKSQICSANKDNLSKDSSPLVNLQPSVNSELGSALDEEEEDEHVWEDANEYIEQEMMNRMIDVGVNISSKKIKSHVNVDHFYESTIYDIKQEIAYQEGKFNFNRNDKDFLFKRDLLNKKLQKLESCLEYKKSLNKVEIKAPNLSDPKFVKKLTIPERWYYYNSWIEDYITAITKQLQTVITSFQRKSKALEETKSLEHLHIMKNSSVVGMTTTGAAKFSKVIKDLGPKIVIMEEAAEILESHVVISLSSKCEHLILIETSEDKHFGYLILQALIEAGIVGEPIRGSPTWCGLKAALDNHYSRAEDGTSSCTDCMKKQGDHQQLKPSTTVHDLAVKYNLNTSLFERMINNGVRYEALQFQHRMRPSISKLLVPNIYPSLKDDDSVHGREHIKGVTKDIYFIDHQFYEDKAFDDNNSHENAHEANLIMALCRHLLLQGYEPNRITILTAYSGQFFLLKKIQRDHPVCASVKICVVDNFQGEENDIILLSLVRSNTEGNVGFLKIDNRVCVALSRAKNGFYITGNMNQLSSKSELWKNINKTLSDQGSIGPSIELKCENHPEILTQVSSGQQILQRSPEGGCLLQCSFNFEACGHPCPRTCHVRDMDHEKFKCLKPCLRKICERDEHLCYKKCWELCGPCMRPVEKSLPCGHTHTLKCHIDPALYPCPTKVEREIPDCQHVNKMPCHSKVTDCICSYQCNAVLDCGHHCKLICHRKDDPNHVKYICKEICSLLKKECSLNHPCTKRCYEECALCVILVEKKLPCGHRHNNVKCYVKPEEIICKKVCSKVMSCGHHCTRECYLPCGGCEKIVEKFVPECGHKVKMACRKNPILYPCTTIVEREIPDCHHVNKMPCHSKATDCICSYPCDTSLDCGHKCKLKCHLKDDPNHDKYICQAKCSFLNKDCSLNHSCTKRCFEECALCIFSVEKVLPCGHRHNKVKCHEKPEEIECKKVCAKVKPCGHHCTKECCEPCGSCEKIVEKFVPECGHKVKMACRKNPILYPCPTIVEREIPDCHHVNKMPCHSKATDCICSYPCDTRLDCGHQCKLKCHIKDDPNHDKYICQAKCSLLNKDCSLNHPCTKRCFEECALCTFSVEKVLPCGHRHNKVKCHEKPEEIQCKKVCTKVMPCGHHCTRECCEPCGGCEEIVEKFVQECGHKVKMACGKNPTKQFCKGRCVLKLSCGHNCKAKCQDPCTTTCTELVLSNYRCPQNHPIQVECHSLSKPMSDSEQELVGLWCKEICNRPLSCGHTCKGKCGDCFNGRVHMPCNEPCGKPLVCGHVCKSPCSMDCPPCKDYCEFKCGHSRCKKKCAVPCNPCQERCLWKCPHKICREICGNICSRDPCTEPCPKELKCKHPCIGFCGDPCPQLCRICNQDELTELILSGLEGEDDARYVMLEDCQHVIEVTALEQWLNINNEEIGIKQCPRCKMGIFNSRRYNKIIKNTYQDVNKVKFKYFNSENSSTIKKEIAAILKPEKSEMKSHPTAVLEPQEIGPVRKFYSSECTALLKSVGMESMDSSFQTYRRKHYSTTEYGIVLFKATTLEKASTILIELQRNFNKEPYSDIVRKILEVLVQRVLNIQDRVSSQLAEEVTSELQRIGILSSVSKLRSRKNQNYMVAKLYSQIEKLINPTIKFEGKLEQKVRILLRESEKYVGGLGIDESERSMILQAMQLTQGHWYKCPNGHVYCITECGGATQVSHCPDCGAKVGGGSHQLLSDNAVATEMDGATYAAWSEQANLANYEMNDFID